MKRLVYYGKASEHTSVFILPAPLSQPLTEEVSHAQSQELPW